MNIRLLLLIALALPINLAGAADPSVIFDMDAVRHQPATVGTEKVPVGTVEMVEGMRAGRFSCASTEEDIREAATGLDEHLTRGAG